MKLEVMETNTDKILDFLDHLWPYISGMVVTILAGIKLWWHSHKETKKQIQDNAAAIIAIHNNMATKEELHSCREDVRVEDKAILREIKETNRINQEQHDKITQDGAKQFKDLMDQIIRLHSGK